jgi:cation diffusion facilitator CzcD-associated flavoprotein CzcO
MSIQTEVVIVGAGPYGLSCAAHLRSRGIRFRIFGHTMSTWRHQMPKGMLLKSDGFASNLSDPQSSLTLQRYCAEHSISYHDKAFPVTLETFTAYGIAFQKSMVPEVEEKNVVLIERAKDGFSLRLDDGENLTCRRVLLAVGITHFAYVPPELRTLPQEFLTHSSAHNSIEGFDGREMTIIGGGASAIDLAALAAESGASTTIIARRSALKFHAPPNPNARSLWNRLRHPESGIGPGLRSRFFTSHPELFYFLPQKLRLYFVRRHLGPAAGWSMKPRVLGKVKSLLGQTIRSAELRNNKVRLTLAGSDGVKTEHSTDHVIAATGYQVDLHRLTFLDGSLRQEIRTFEKSPVLSPSFESTVPGLYFVGLAAANSFGPLLRFAFGAEFAARRISGHIAKGVPVSAVESIPEASYDPKVPSAL